MSCQSIDVLRRQSGGGGEGTQRAAIAQRPGDVRSGDLIGAVKIGKEYAGTIARVG